MCVPMKLEGSTIFCICSQLYYIVLFLQNISFDLPINTRKKTWPVKWLANVKEEDNGFDD